MIFIPLWQRLLVAAVTVAAILLTLLWAQFLEYSPYILREDPKPRIVRCFDREETPQGLSYVSIQTCVLTGEAGLLDENGQLIEARP